MCGKAHASPRVATREKAASFRPRPLFVVDWSGRFSGLIDGAFSQIAQGFVGVFFFRQRRLEEPRAGGVAQLVGPGGERAIAGDLVVLDCLGGGNETGIKGGRALVPRP